MTKLELDTLFVDCFTHHCQKAFLKIKALAALGAAVEEMPFNSSLHHRPLNDSNNMFPLGTFQWVFERVGENTCDAQDPYMALTFHTIPESGPIND